MGNFCGKEGPKKVKKHELAFMGICTEGSYNDPGLIDTIFNEAKKEGKEYEIF